MREFLAELLLIFLVIFWGGAAALILSMLAIFYWDCIISRFRKDKDG